MQTETFTGFRLSPQQRRLWLSQQDSQACRAQCALLLEGKLDPDALRAALNKVLDRHEVLRTTYRRRSGMKIPLQVISERALLDWRLADGSVSSPAEHEERIRLFLREEGGRPFDFERGPVVRAALLVLSANQHVLLLGMPSLCADAETLKILVQELRCFYAGGSPSEELAEQPLQYADFSEWQNQLLEADDAEARAGKAYWDPLALGSAAPLALPFQSKACPEKTFAPDCETLRIAPEVFRRIELLSRQHESSAAVFLLTCWQILLGRLTGQAEIPVGCVFDGRKQEELQGAMGLFAQTLRVLGHLENLPFLELLRKTQKSFDGAYQWQEYYPGAENGQAAADFEFETWLAKQSAGDLSFSVYQQFCHVNRFHLKLSCAQQGDACVAFFHYDSQVLQRQDVQRIAGYFARLLEGVIADLSAPIGSVEILSDAERQQLLVAFNQTATEYPRDRCIHELFEEQVERTPNRLALVFAEQQFSYAELNARANQLAHFLRRRGIGTNVPVGLCMERSADMLVGVLGILKAGGAYVPLHTELPKARLAYQLAETKTPWVVTQEKLLGQLPDFGGGFLCLDRDQAALADEPKSNPERTNCPEDLAYVIYTSGSTGVPKGVAVRHRNLVNYTHFIKSKLNLEASEASGGLHFATVSTMSADLGNTCIFPSLISGGCLHVVSYETAMTGTTFAHYVSSNAIDVLKITPSHLSALLAGQEVIAVLPRKYLILGGEACSWELVRLVTRAGKCAVINHYGPTETTVGSLTYCLQEMTASSLTSATVPIGRPIANTEVYILDSSRRPVPLGAPGELYIGGTGVAQGYLNQPEQTAERFIPHPFSSDPDARLYKTGDQARYLRDGNVEFLGRLDEQVKIRGFRVEPAEIEGVLRRHPAVQQAVVVAQIDQAGDRRLVAYFVPAGGRGVPVDELRSFLREQLPDYMVPSTFVLLQSLPLTANGKVDRRALPDPDETRLATDKAFVGSRNPVEEKLAGIWKEVLGVERVGVHDDFFELGGHSLLATQVIARIRSAFQVDLPLRSLFESPSVAALAEEIGHYQEMTADDEDMGRLLAELEGLSDEEIQKLLAAEMQSQDG